jgi:hypothetical protein
MKTKISKSEEVKWKNSSSGVWIIVVSEVHLG